MVPKPKSEKTENGSVLDTISESRLTTTNNNNANIKEILYDGYFYDVSTFIHKHPGGTIIDYYTKPGEDATHAIQQFHQRSPAKIKTMMNCLKKRPAKDEDYCMTLDQLQKHRALTEDFTKLYLELEKEGFFKPSPAHMLYRILELVVMSLFAFWLMLYFTNPVIKFLGMALWGIVQGRSGWVQHECGHHSFTGVPKIDRMLHAVLFGIGLGLSSSWWARGHNRHHAMPQRVKHDVDLDTMPFLCYNKKVVDNPQKGKNFFVYNQAFLFLAIDTLLGSFLWGLVLHPKYCIKHGKYMQLFWMLVHYSLHYPIGFWAWIIGNWVGSAYLFGNFALSHSHLEATTEPTHWVHYALIHTADVEQAPWCDWWMGYLNYQIEHHLFPTMPQFRQPLIHHRVRALAKKHGLPYICYSYSEAMRVTFANLNKVATDFKNAKGKTWSD